MCPYVKQFVYTCDSTRVDLLELKKCLKMGQQSESVLARFRTSCLIHVVIMKVSVYIASSWSSDHDYVFDMKCKC